MKTVIEMWHKAWPDPGTFVRASAQDLERFAELVRADEREAMRERLEQPAQPSKPWVWLTDEELEKVFPAIATYHEANKTLYRSIARAIEAKLKEKNT